MNEHDLDFLIADAMTKVDALLARGAHYDNVAIVVTPSVYYRLARRNDCQWCENVRIDGNGYYGRYHGFNIYIVENAPVEDMCFPAFYYETNDTLIPIHPGEYLIFGNNEELYQTDDGVTIRDSGMRVTREVQPHMIDPMYAEATSAAATATLDSILSDELMRAIRNPFGGELYATAASTSDGAPHVWESTYLNSWMHDFVSKPFKRPVAKAKRVQVEPELQPTPELDEFIEQFRRK